MNVVIIVQARMGSTRLPGKVLRPIMDKPMLALHVERLKRVSRVSRMVVATTTDDADEPIVQLCRDLGVAFFRGSETHVLERYYQAAAHFQADVILRICSDSPLTDPGFLDALVDFYVCSQPPYDYVGGGKNLALGLGAEIFSFSALEQAYQSATLPEEKEHVTPYLYGHPDKFRLGRFSGASECSGYRLTVDTEEDFALMEWIFRKLYPTNPNFTYEDVRQLLVSHPDMATINAHVTQKSLKNSV